MWLYQNNIRGRLFMRFLQMKLEIDFLCFQTNTEKLSKLIHNYYQMNEEQSFTPSEDPLSNEHCLMTADSLNADYYEALNAKIKNYLTNRDEKIEKLLSRENLTS